MNKKTGVLYLMEIERSPVELSFDSKEKTTPWVQKILEKAAPDPRFTGVSAEEWASKCELHGNAKFERLGDEYMLAGSFEARVEASCSRCGDLFPTDRKNSFQIFFEAAEKRQGNQKLEDGGDPDYVVLETDQIALPEIFAEQLVVQEPMAECPGRKADGSCEYCGKNPQFTGHDTQKGEESGAFSKLKDLAGRL